MKVIYLWLQNNIPVYVGNISKCCRGELKHTGYLADGTPLEFEYII